MASQTVVSGFEPMVGQQFPIRIIQRFLRRAALPHALLFTGTEGVGKRSTARVMAMALNCRNGTKSANEGPAGAVDQPCRKCPVCRQIEAGNHPDILEISPRKGILRIDQIRGLLATLALKPFSAANRVVILADAHKMNLESGNALLKVLEEPPRSTRLVLTAPQRSDLLGTVVSRCRVIPFNPLPEADLAELLIETQGLDQSTAKTLAKAAAGSYTRALHLAQGKWHQRRDWLIRAAGLGGIDGRQLSTAPLALALAFALELSQDKMQIENDLETLKGWVRDLGVWPYHPDEIINADRWETLQVVRRRLSDGQLLELWEILEKTQKDIAGNANLRLTLDNMALRMARLRAA